MGVIRTILTNMKDTPDPVNGMVFEKMVECGLEDFNQFMFFCFKNVTAVKQLERGQELHLFYLRRDHIGTYVPGLNIGYFGGSRIGSQNPWRNPEDPAVTNPFNISINASSGVITEDQR